MKTYLLKEGNEEFLIEVETLEEAEAAAAMYNAVIIKEVV